MCIDQLERWLRLENSQVLSFPQRRRGSDTCGFSPACRGLEKVRLRRTRTMTLQDGGEQST